MTNLLRLYMAEKESSNAVSVFRYLVDACPADSDHRVNLIEEELEPPDQQD